MTSKATSFSNLRRLGLKPGDRRTGDLDRYKSNSQDLLNENNIKVATLFYIYYYLFIYLLIITNNKTRLDEELNWLEGSRPSSRSIENLLGGSPGNIKAPQNGNVEEKKRKLLSAGLFSADNLDQLDRHRGSEFNKCHSY